MVCRRRCGWVWCRQGRPVPTSTQALPTGAATSEWVYTTGPWRLGGNRLIDSSCLLCQCRESPASVSSLKHMWTPSPTHSLHQLSHSLTRSLNCALTHHSLQVPG